MTAEDQERRAAERQCGRKGDHATRRRQCRFQRNEHQPDRGEGLDAAGRDCDGQHEARERKRRQHMRAFIAAGARQEPGYEDRCDQPRERRDLERIGRASESQIDREYGKGRKAAEQPRRHEGAMTRTSQRVITRRRMQQRIETIADDTQHSHGYSRFGLSRTIRPPERPLVFSHRVRATLNER